MELTGSFSVILPLKAPIGAAIILDTKEIKLNKRQQDIFAIIQKNKAINIQKIEKELKAPPTQRMIRKDLSHLREENLITLQGYGKSALWILKEKN